jgi:hypothetical protein
MRYAPALFVVAVRVSFVCNETAVTAAPATAAPEASVIVPAIVPCGVCAKQLIENRQMPTGR